ncbi:hypothetical protein M901_1338, partial [Bacteriovorax sp. DB6_IX]
MSKDKLKENILSKSFFRTPDNKTDREYAMTLDEKLGFDVETIESELSQQY